MPTDTSEKGLESLIVKAMTIGSDWVSGNPTDFDCDNAVDLATLGAFIKNTQPELFKQLGLDADNQKRREFLARLQGEIAKRGVVQVLRNGLKHGALEI